MAMRTAVLAAAASLALVGAAPAAGIYKWVDEQGKVHYGDRPPAGAASETVDTPAPAASGETGGGAPTEAERRERRRRLLEAYERERTEREAERAREREARAKRKALARRCARARDRLTRMREATYLYDVDENGERRIFGREEREQATRRLEREIAKHCH